MTDVPRDDHETYKMHKLDKMPSIDALIEVGALYVDLQPVVDLASGTVFGYEALARCRVDELRSPLRLFEYALEQRAVGKLGRALRECAVQAVGAARLFVNIHPDELDEEYLSRNDDPIYRHAGEVVVELPESMPLTRYRNAPALLANLRAARIGIALDDFGAGYCNFGCLPQLAPTIVKIDRELIAGVETKTRAHALLSSLTSLCRDQGATVVAEGIETERELASVLAAGIPLGQGYFLGRPSATGAPAWPTAAGRGVRIVHRPKQRVDAA